MLTILQGDALAELRKLPSESVQCCVTSPPYWGLRDYGTAQWEGGGDRCDHIESFRPQRDHNGRDFGESRGTEDSRVSTKIPFKHICNKCGSKRIDSQLGLEKTPEEYVAKLVEVFREVRRVLRKDGTLWLNLGDSYAGSGKGGNPEGSEWAGFVGNKDRERSMKATSKPIIPDGLKPKDLCGIPWRVAFGLQADGWWLRSDIIWAKPNPMPESVTDRPTKSHEYLFLLTKSANYFYDAEAIKEQSTQPFGIPRLTAQHKADADGFTTNGTGNSTLGTNQGESSRNKRSVWTVATAPYPEAHFATYPPDLIKPCILAGTSAKGCCAKCGSPWARITESEFVSYGSKRINTTGQDFMQGWKGTTNGRTDTKTIGWQPTCECPVVGETAFEMRHEFQPCTVLDPFAGSGTTGAVALELGRKAILIELNPKYVELIRQRCDVTPGLALA